MGDRPPGLKGWLAGRITAWLVRDVDPLPDLPLSDFERLQAEIRPADVLLVEGRSRISRVIKAITQSPWTHAALYVGRLAELRDPALRCILEQALEGQPWSDPHEQLVIEALLGEGTVLKPLSKYAGEHLRLCRPRGLSRADAHRVIGYAARHLGADYDVRQLLDLARLLAPWTILPRRWRSSLLAYHAGIPTRTVCSSMIAAAFAHVRFPILPVLRRDDAGRLRLFPRNTRLYTPRDFDCSPYFDIVKYPPLGFDELGLYRQLPWDEEGVVCNDPEDCFVPEPAPALRLAAGPGEEADA